MPLFSMSFSKCLFTSDSFDATTRLHFGAQTASVLKAFASPGLTWLLVEQIIDSIDSERPVKFLVSCVC